MSFPSMQLTDAGRGIIVKALSGSGSIQFTKIQIGNGEEPEDIDALTELQNPLKDISITEITTGDGIAVLNGQFDNAELTSGFYWKELGVYATDEDLGEVLYAYAYAGEYTDYVPAYSGTCYLKTTLNIAVVVGDATTVSAVIGEYSGYASKEAFEAHLSDTDNPHNVTSVQVGLGNVPNVATNDQTPTYSVASALTALVSGEALSTAFGKIAKAVSSLISHIADTTIHVTSSEKTTWNSKAAASHTHSATDITSGTLGIARGGTGATSAEAATHSLCAIYGGAVSSTYRITSGKDLDSYTTGGTYWCSSASAARGVSNTPYTGSNFTLLVFSPYSTHTYQMLLPNNGGTTTTIYLRSRNSGTWGGWNRITTTQVE